MSDGDSGAAAAKDPFDTLVINQETDIVEIIGGLQCIVNTCLDITSDGQRIQEDPDAELPDHERQKREQLRRTTNNNNNGFLS
jgi:predicted secreted protein